eukprot:comp20565_c0_seq1/m.26435 comp20565_c0_seq1/g.26435  ORF comp20565_c0_seq1/g.26435 comp20565_c0_seq1/m.26435 type:complete len:497 (-) comp20565_c0_seq1:80-1570(-)
MLLNPSTKYPTPASMTFYDVHKELELERILFRLHALKQQPGHEVDAAELVKLQHALGTIRTQYLPRGPPNADDSCGRVVEATIHNLQSACYDVLEELLEATDRSKEVGEALKPMHTRLLDTKHDLEKLYFKVADGEMKLLDEELLPYREALYSIESGMVDGKFVDEKGDVPPGQAAVLSEMHQCYHLLELLTVNLRLSPHPLLHVRNRLATVHSRLAKLQAKGKHMTTEELEEKLKSAKSELDAIDSLRVDAKFFAPDGSVPPGQAHLHFMLDDCYMMIQDLMEKAEGEERPVAPELMGTYERLRGIHTELSEMAKQDASQVSEDEIRKVQNKLTHIDERRVDGKFQADDGSIPPGQAVMHEWLHRCHRLIGVLLGRTEGEDELAREHERRLIVLKTVLGSLAEAGREYFTQHELNMAHEWLWELAQAVQEHQSKHTNREMIAYALVNECYDQLSELQRLLDARTEYKQEMKMKEMKEMAPGAFINPEKPATAMGE